MRTTIRRIAVGVATAGLATAGIVAGAPAANAANANSCLNQLSRSGPSYTQYYITNKGSLPVATGLHRHAACAGMTVSIGISRTNTADFRNRPASRGHYESDVYYFYARYALDADDIGVWMTRQIAVGDRNGRLAVRTFTNSTTPHRVTVKHYSVLTGTPTGKLRLDSKGRVAIRGSLKAWHSSGRLINLQNQDVLVQTRLNERYQWVTLGALRTGRYGTFGAPVKLSGHRGKQVRLLYVSQFRTIASDGHYLGRVG